MYTSVHVRVRILGERGIRTEFTRYTRVAQSMKRAADVGKSMRSTTLYFIQSVYSFFTNIAHSTCVLHLLGKSHGS